MLLFEKHFIDHFPLREALLHTSDEAFTKHKHDICPNKYKAYRKISIQQSAHMHNTIQCVDIGEKLEKKEKTHSKDKHNQMHIYEA